MSWNLVQRWQMKLIFMAVFLAVVCGIQVPQLFDKIAFLGDLFLDLLKLFALPLICTSLIAAVGGMGKNLGSFKLLARNAFSYMILSEIIAVSIALVLFNVFTPGTNVPSELVTHGSPLAVNAGQHIDVPTFLLSIFPHNIVADMAAFNLLPVVIFSIFFGGACAIRADRSENIIKLAESVRDVIATCLDGVMIIAPLGVFALVGKGVAEAARHGQLIDTLLALCAFVGILVLGLLLHALWQFTLMIMLSRQRPLTVLKSSLPVFAVAFATSSSVSTLPVAMKTADKLKSRREVTSFMLPFSAAINIGGMMLYEVAAVLFFAQVLGLHLPLTQQIAIAIMCILCGMAAGGIPETSMVSMMMVFKMAGIPLSAISILLPLDRIIDRIRTMVNIFGNMCGVITVSQVSRPNFPARARQNSVNSIVSE